MDQPTGLFTYAYDRAGRMSTLTSPANEVTSWQYDAASRVTSAQLPNGVIVSKAYDSADRLLLLANLTASGTTLSSFNYTYNPFGNRTKVVEDNGDVLTLSYDPTYQLTSEFRSGANAYGITYAYDPVGNRALLINNGAVTTYTYNVGNELVASQTNAGVTSSSYDGNGNVLTSVAPGNQWTTNTWDGENRLATVALASGLTNSFGYNGDGERVLKQDSTGTTNQFWDGRNVLLETNAGGIVQAAYAVEPKSFGNLISMARSTATSFYLFDGLGSTTQLVDSEGSVSDSYLYDSFGNILASSGDTENVFRFVGRLGYQYSQDLGQHFLIARYYSPSQGRFVSRDPLGPNSSDSNLYRYCMNRPSMLTDPSGLDVIDWLISWCKPQRPKPRCQNVCGKALAQGLVRPGQVGGVICCDGVQYVCAWWPGGSRYGFQGPCTLQHEGSHLPNNLPCDPESGENLYQNDNDPLKGTVAFSECVA